jgi:phosphoglycolate phosphatase
MKKLILFDIDGTILSFKKPISKIIFRKVLLELFDIKISIKAMPSFAGKTDIQILKEISISIGYDFNNIKSNLNNIWDEMTKHFIKFCTKENIVVFPGIIKIIEELNKNKNIHLGLLTGNYMQNAYLKLDVVNLSQYFHFGAFGSDSDDRNQLPGIAIERANNHLNTETFNCTNTVIIGDSPLDIECAKRNKIRNVIVATGNFSIEELSKCNPDCLFNDFSNHHVSLNAIIGVC